MPDTALPADLGSGTFALRVMTPDGPSIFALLQGAAFDMTPAFGTCSAWLNAKDPVAAIRTLGVPAALDLPAALANAHPAARDATKPWRLAPIDLQAVKAAGVTYVCSMLERVIEERCRGDATQAEAVPRRGTRDHRRRPVQPRPRQPRGRARKAGAGRQGLVEPVPGSRHRPGCGDLHQGARPVLRRHGVEGRRASDELLVEPGAGSGDGGEWPRQDRWRDARQRREPARRGRAQRALLGRAKDNNASSALGPMIRLFDAGFTLEDVRRAELRVTITGRDGFELDERGPVGAIARDPADVVGQMIGAHHQYPDGAVLFLGTPFSPIKDRGAPGMGFTHKSDDVVRISSPRLGALENEVDRTDECPPWTFGIGALMANLARRGLPR
jgi:fumarylacetoacetate (FAA) hydrolase family protein